MKQVNAEVFAWYGQAIAIAQLLEASLIFYLSVMPPTTKKRRQHPEAQRQFLESLDRKTLGALRDELGRFPGLDEAAKTLEAVNGLRIDLVHSWFRSPARLKKLESCAGRGELVEELRGATDRLGTTPAAVSVAALFIAFGRKPRAADVSARRT
jgi:hypothetical protein